MPRPSTCARSSITTAFVVVDPRSMPMKHFMAGSARSRRRGDALTLLVDHLEVALQPVLHVRRREVPGVHQVRLDERARLAGALLDLAHDHELAGREAVAA